MSENPPLELAKTGSQALAWEPTCFEAPASSDMRVSPDTQEAREAGTFVPAFPSQSLETSEEIQAPCLVAALLDVLDLSAGEL